MFNETLAWLASAVEGEEISEIDFSFHRQVAQQLLVILDEPSVEGDTLVALCAFTVGGLRRKACLFETDEPVSCRVPYPEDEMMLSLEVAVETRRALLHDQLPYSDIEIWVAMTKALHYKVFAHLPGKWMFVRGRFPRYTRSTEVTERLVVIASSFSDKLTRSEVLHDGAKVGEIFFSRV
jgi:hypothetical protein